MTLDAFAASLSLITVAEIGDKTQLLSLMLAARYRKPVPIILGIFAATLLNHGVSAWFGHWLGGAFDPSMFEWAINISFVAIGIWTLVPDKLDDCDEACAKRHHGIFWTTLVCFFLAEIGDKTQIATIALGAQYVDTLQVIAGTTLGMLAANIPAVLLGKKLLKKISLAKVRYVAAVLYTGFGMWGIVRLMVG